MSRLSAAERRQQNVGSRASAAARGHGRACRRCDLIIYLLSIYYSCANFHTVTAARRVCRFFYFYFLLVNLKVRRGPAN